MDIQSIIKQILSVAEIVIKNPSTSVKNSGIDLSSIAQMAGSLLGNNANKEGGSGLGSILGSAAQSGALGSILGSMLGGGQQQQSAGGGLGSILGSVLGGTLQKEPQQSEQPQQQSAGGLGSILGSVLGGGQQQQSAGGALGSILGSVLGGGQQQQQPQSNTDLLGQLVSKAGTIKDMLTGSSSQNLNTEQKGNLSDVLGMINIAKAFMGGKQ
ncbi:MAG: hypothetical protein MJZ61_03955 [Bacteroidales bacterium]|nr:hypothetical protein [Bacteroidales bacterium]